MTISKVIEGVRVNGKEAKSTFGEQITEGNLILSASQISSLNFEIHDDHNLTISSQAEKFFGDGSTITWEGFAFSVEDFETGGGTEYPTISIEATSDFVNSLKEETGGKNWGDMDVSLFAKQVIESKGAKALVQPNLGKRPIERIAPEGDGQKGESTWDVLVEAGTQVGAWVFEYGSTIVVAKPSWIVAQAGMREFTVTWDTWTEHSDSLTGVPQYKRNRHTEPWEGKESLTITAIDPDTGTFPLFQARPGDIVKYKGKGAPSADPIWIVREVRHSLVVGYPTTISCWRPIDPPEIVQEGASSGSDSAGVPNGPLGEFNWQGEQLKNAAEIVKEGQRRGLPDIATKLAVACAMGESSLRNIGYGDAAGPDSTGLFQQRDSWGSRSERLTPSKAAGFFLDALTAQPYKSNYENGANALPVANTGAIYIGPGKTANAASVTIHRVQVNADPYHYAKFWADAQLVVQACIDAGKSSGGGSKASGPLGQNIDKLMRSYEGQSIDVDGAYQAQCVDLAAKYITDLKGIPMIRGNGLNYYNHPDLRGAFETIHGFNKPRKGDVASWSGSKGAYPNGGYGHVAIYSHFEGGEHYFLSQNPGPSRIMPLQTAGINGLMRPRP